MANTFLNVNGSDLANINVTIENVDLEVQIRAASGDNIAITSQDGLNELSIDAGGAAKVDGSAVTQPVSAASLPLPTGAATAAQQLPNNHDVTVTNFPATQPISAVSLPLPTGASTAANQATEIASLASIDGKITTTANGIRVDAIISDGSGPVTVDGTVAISGSVAVTGPLTDAQLRASAVPISAATLPLPTGAATSALQTQPGVDIGDVTVNNASGAAAVNIQDGGNSITVDGPLTDAQLRASSVPVDTELPTAILLTDSLTNPTITAIANYNLHYSSAGGGGWERTRGDGGALYATGEVADGAVAGIIKPLQVAGIERSSGIIRTLSVDANGAVEVTQGPPALIANGWPVMITNGSITADLNTPNTDGVLASALQGLAVGSVVYGFNGTGYDRITGNSANGLDVDVTRSALPTGASTLAEQQTQTTALQLIDDIVFVDNSGYTDNSSKLAATGHLFDEVVGTALTENDIAVSRIDSKRAQVMVLEDATNRGTRATLGSPTADAIASSGFVALATTANGYMFNGSTWDRLRSVINGQNTTGTGIQAVGSLGQLDDTAPGAVTENQFAPIRITALRAQHTNLRDNSGNEVIFNSSRRTYVAASAAFTPPATPTDLFTITGSASTTVKVTKMGFSTLQTTGGYNTFIITKRSTANSGGTSANLVEVSLDSANAAATATCLSYTANPTTGTRVGDIWIGRVPSPAAATVGTGITEMVVDFGLLYGHPVVLRGTSEVLALNFNGAALPTGLSVVAWVEFTEE